MSKASTATIFAFREGKVYALTVQRANTKKWNRKVMFGSAESRKKHETAKDALMRGLKEELGITPKTVRKVIAIGQTRPETEHLGYTAQSFLVEVPFEMLEALVKRINQDPRRFHELRNARISSLRNLGKNKRVLQAHYKGMLPMIRHRLGKEGQARREAIKRRRTK